jgi:hypothetical protein
MHGITALLVRAPKDDCKVGDGLPFAERLAFLARLQLVWLGFVGVESAME